MKYKYYLFPFNEVPKNSKIIIYGAGKVGLQFVEQIKLLNYCKCLFVVDKYFKEIQCLNGTEVCDPEQIIGCEYDKIVIASHGHNDEIYNNLLKLNVPSQKIVRKIFLHEYAPAIKNLMTPDPKNSTAWNAYYESAESRAKKQFDFYFKPILSKYEDINLDMVLDFACGHGRIANIFSKISKNIICCDVNATAIHFCKERFHNNKDCRFEFVTNKMTNNSLTQLPFERNIFSFIYSWDAMVHFSYKWLDFYIKEFYRILSNNSYVMIHHSNYAYTDKLDSVSENWYDNPNGRTSVSYEDIKFIAQNHGFTVLEQKIIDWNYPNLDCISILKKCNTSTC